MSLHAAQGEDIESSLRPSTGASTVLLAGLFLGCSEVDTSQDTHPCPRTEAKAIIDAPPDLSQAGDIGLLATTYEEVTALKGAVRASVRQRHAALAAV